MKWFNIKKALSSLLIISMCVIPSLPVCAAQTEHKEKIVSEEYAISQKKMVRYGEREVITVLNSENVSVVVTPDGQQAGGYRFPTGGGLYVNTSGGPSISVGLSVSWGGVVSTNVSVGLASLSSSVGGLFLTAPNNTNYFKAQIKKTYKVERHKVDVYQYNEYKYTYYSTPSTFYSLDAYLVRV